MLKLAHLDVDGVLMVVFSWLGQFFFYSSFAITITYIFQSAVDLHVNIVYNNSYR